MLTMEESNSDSFSDTKYDDGYDVVVVGSGYGGSVAACRLSMAGFKVCLLEKGRKWEAKDFPTNTLKMLSAVRVESKNLGISFGPKDALFQVNIQDDSLAATACGLGGGSLVNAGVMLPTTVRARKDPKWPKAWEKDWERYEAIASDMLRVQSVPMKFPNSKIMQEVMDDKGYNKDKQLKLSLNIDMEEHFSGSKRSYAATGECLACGNCLSGCAYNAKNSTDKTYLVSAAQAGCTIKTECEVQYVVINEDDTCKMEGGSKGKSARRWLVFVNEFDYIASDIVILSAGVFGTTKILFQSQLRGLSVSEMLGSGVSCNGNSMAYLAGSSAPLNASGLNKKQITNIPFQERPGPSISSSYTSSLGFTIQSAVIPTTYPVMAITTYGSWQSRKWLLLDITDRLKQIIGLKHSTQSMSLNAMGHDESNGRITFEKSTNRITFRPPHDPLLPRKIEAFRKLAKRLGGILRISRYRSTSVHLLGGCIASSDASSGVCNPNGQIFDTSSPSGTHTGLYICDASIIPCSVGINPCLTIASAAEHVSGNIVQEYSTKIRSNIQKEGFISKYNTMEKSCNLLEVMTTDEIMRGEVGGMPCDAYLKLRFRNLRFYDKTGIDEGKSHPLLRGKVGGYIVCKGIEIDKMYVIHGEVDLCKVDRRTPYTQYMHYRLLVAASSGSRYVLEGRKIMNPYLLAVYAWRESTTLNVTLEKITNNVGDKAMRLKGRLHISPLEFLKSMCALKGESRKKFVFLLTQSLFRTYIMQVPRGIQTDFTPLEPARGPYPDSTIHEIRTEDDCIISCQHWLSSQISQELNLEKKFYPVLLLNGYSTQSYCLPTEPNDLVRTLLKEGHDVVLLHTRLSPLSNSSDFFSIEDIGRIDIPAAMDKITSFYGESIKVHLVAHCVGGLAIHMSLMGGHISAKNIVSLSCTNSSMFFKLTTSSLVKMRLPLIPISMAIMGKNKKLPLIQTSSATTFRHSLLKSIARLIPRCERCTCDECEVFSGIFGNTFWHENISDTMHYWMNKENLPRLPMGAFPHLRKICNAGFIVDENGNNSYLIHPERIPLPTLYISGGRTLLVTPETSFLANKYMKLHQPGYRHERVVVDGFGHSDLLIGEKSHDIVFPRIIKHIELAEVERSSFRTRRGDTYFMKEALEWSADPYYEDVGTFGSWVFHLIIVGIMFVFVFTLLLS